MTCPQDCSLQHQSSRAVLPFHRDRVLGQYEKSSRQPVKNAIPVSIWSCEKCRKQWLCVGEGEQARWTDAVSDNSFRRQNAVVPPT